MVNAKIQDQYRAKKRFWQVHIRAWSKSGLSQNEYCRRNGLRPNQFCYWKKKIKNCKDGAVKFVPVPVPSVKVVENHSLADSGLTISFDNITIKLQNDFNPAVLTDAVMALSGKP